VAVENVSCTAISKQTA